MIDIELIPKIEEALGFKLYEQQILALTIDVYLWSNGRATGRTTVYMIKLALSDGEPIDMKEFRCFTNRKFFNIFMETRNKLKEYGFKVREIKF